MSTMVKSLLGDYSQAVSQFQAASRGGYSGPSTPIGLLGDMVGSVDGINPGDLVTNTASAMGARRPGRGGNGLREFLLGTVLSLAGGAIMDHLRGVQDDFDKERDEADDLVESAQQCSDAIEDVVDVSDSAVAELISAVIPLINILTMLLQRHPLGKVIIPVISRIGGELIDQTNDTITQTCRDRDTAIENCYDEFERRCTEVCERELPETPPEPECGCEEKRKECPQPEPEPCAPAQPSPAPAPSTPSQPTQPAQPSAPAAPQQPVEPKPETPVAPPEKPEPTQPATVPEKDCPPVEEKPQPATPTEPSHVPTEPASTAPEEEHTPCRCNAEKEAQSCGCGAHQRELGTTKPADAGVEVPTEPVPQKVVDCPENVEPAAEDIECPEEPVGDEDCEEAEQPPGAEAGECKPEEACCGSLGLLGVGVAILGLGLLAEAAMDFVENLPEPEPVPEPVPEPEPQPEPEPCPPPAPEPAPDNGVTPPPPELNNVPEPEAPPEKLAHMQAAEAPAPQPAPAPAPAPEPVPGPAAGAEATPEMPPQESSETSSVHARKAGQW
ncbi:zinc metalloprotease [Corynebacterium sp. HMSC072D12]|uniref:zinc metalloprotease n=1 Tax=Corynebacterium sp. HMSC072D12 TaxID=1739447 RepID=UPI0008A45A8E|nr:zinc metalloprotease [Corynebacterium sp. HMSC072D12]OFQ33477.1 zinc metalloprotease [Corynebacterium sp. HMSC072D12]